MNIAICLFGITRSLRHTLPSIESRAIAPARMQGNLRIFAHFFRQHGLQHARTGERGPLDPGEYRLLQTDRLELEDPDACLTTWDYESLKLQGDAWKTDFLSLRNLVHQLHSLNRTTAMALAEGADVCLFLRPDLRYHDSLAPAISHALQAARAGRTLVQLPRWQPWGGCNDRFAIVTGAEAIAAYGRRVTQMADFCAATGRPLHSERLLAHALNRAGIAVRPIAARASRVRLDGSERYEDFWPPHLSALRRKMRHRVFHALGRDPARRFDGSVVTR